MMFFSQGRTYEFLISTSDALPLSYGRLVVTRPLNKVPVTIKLQRIHSNKKLKRFVNNKITKCEITINNVIQFSVWFV